MQSLMRPDVMATDAASESPPVETAMSDMMTMGRTRPTDRARTGSGSAGILVLAVAAALVWSNIAPRAYARVWTTIFTVRTGPLAANLDLRTWVNSGLMTLFFLVVGLEARREFDLGELRERRRLVLPIGAGLVGMVVPVLIYLAINRHGPGAHGWGVAMSTDTALALGAYSVVGRGVPDRVRTFLLTVFVVDDVVALVVIAVAYSGHVKPVELGIAVLAFGLLLASRRLAYPRRRVVFTALGIVVWAALLASGIDPVVAGLAIGLVTSAYAPTRGDLEQATGLVRLFREQPSPELARSATIGLAASLSPNARLRHLFHRWSSYAVVPLFALANAGITVDARLLAHAWQAPVTIGVFCGYVLGKPLAVVGVSRLLASASRGRIRPQVGAAAVLGSGAIAGIGFTVSLLIANLAFHGQELQQAKLGILLAAAGATLASWLVYRVTATLPEARRSRALLGDADQIGDLLPPVEPDHDHIRGPADASVTIVEYGDFECPFTATAAPTARDLLSEHPDVRHVWRHLPLTDVHPHAQLAAEATEAAGAQGAFWAMHDLLLANQNALGPSELLDHAARLGLDLDRFTDDLARHAHTARIAKDVESADLSGVSGTPTFFVNDQLHQGRPDAAALTAAIAAARTRVALAAA
jgi:Na+/H+ antiporter NhaA